MIAEIRQYSRMALGLRRALQAPAVADHAALIRDQLQDRHLRFLEHTRRVVFEQQHCPYFDLFQLAGCAYADLEAMVLSDGLESALTAIAKQGVYVTHDEFKGKQPIVRGGRTIDVPDDAFLNRAVNGYFRAATGGSRGPTTQTTQSGTFQRYRESYTVLQNREHDLHRHARCLLFPILPSGLGFSHGLRATRLGWGIAKWFSQRGSTPDAAAYRALTYTMVLAARAGGVRLPFPTYLPDNDYRPAAVWIAERKRAGQMMFIHAFTSPAVRVAVAAREAGIDIASTIFSVGGEALTDAKRAAIEAAGCEVYSHYHISELGPVGYSCRHMNTGNCVHLFHDSLAVVSHRRPAPVAGVAADFLMFTTLLPFAPSFVINAEMDDTGVLEPALCDCTFSAMGLTTQLRNIASIGKLTGQGITLFGTDIVRIIEVSLPQRFGGAPGDYQLVEQEGPGQTQLKLYIDPSVGLRSPNEAARYFLDQVRACYGGALATRLWSHSEGFEAVLAEPIRTPNGKSLPLHLLGPANKEHTHAS